MGAGGLGPGPADGSGDRAVLRIDEEHEVNGIDLIIHAETAYDLHSTAGARTGGSFNPPKATSGPFAPRETDD